MKELESIHFSSKQAFRNWLLTNHDKSPGIWMIFYKTHRDISSIKYNDALEQALCFGWIDSIVKKIDDDKYVRKFTPRTNIKKWSEVNKKKVVELINNGEMTEIGIQKIDSYLKAGKVEWEITRAKEKETKEFDIPGFIVENFAKNEPALINFNNLAPTYKRHYILWITNAKGEETIRKRLNESIELLKENKKLGLK
ncbi:MAG: YdeI/OmpD-associated family protein [Bacteroidia bacterium]|nr:YdeI/OmpD-associated family protein [Bacteroidia bacterium]